MSSFFAVILLIIIPTTMIISSIFINERSKELKKDSINDAIGLTREFDSIFKEFKDFNLYLTQSSFVNEFLYSKSIDDYLTINRTDIIARQLVNLNSHIYSIILHAKYTNYTLLAGNQYVHKEQFFTGEMKSPNTKSSFNMVFGKIASENSSTSNEDSTISILFNDSNKKDIKDESVVVITVNKEEMENNLLKTIKGISFIVDEDGKIVFSSKKDNAILNISKEPFFAEIINSDNTIGSFRSKVDKDKMMVAYAQSSQTGFYIINLRSTDSYISSILKTEIIIIGVSILAIVIFLLIAYFLSNKLYSPIKKITELVSKSKFGRISNDDEEIVEIYDVFTKAFKQISELENKNIDINKRIKEEFLRRLLKSNVVVDLTHNEQDKYDFSIKFTDLYIVCIRIDNYDKFGWDLRLAYETTLCNTIPGVLNNDFVCETVNMYNGEIAVLLNFRKENTSSFDLLVSAMDNVRDLCRSMLSITLTIGIGGDSTKVKDCQDCYNKSKEIVNHRFILGYDKTIYPKILEKVLITDVPYPTELEENLLKAIRLNKKDSFSETLRNLILILKQYPYSKVVSIQFQIIAECIKTINQTTHIDSSKYDLTLEDFRSIFSSFETIEKVEEWLLKIFEEYQEILEKIKGLKNDKYYSIVEKAQQYIANNYQDVNMNVESVADTFGYTSYYFSKIFKEITGINILDFIKNIRINKAKELLSIESIKVVEIPPMTGFSNNSNFYSTFKKTVGLTPSSYREYVLNKKAKEE